MVKAKKKPQKSAELRKKEDRPVRFYRVIDKNLKAFGQIDFTKQTMTLNPTKGDMVNTIIHENLHAKFPDKGEKWIHKRARREESKLSVAEAQRLLGTFRSSKKGSHYKTD